LPEEKGFSERNIGRLIAFLRTYPNFAASCGKNRIATKVTVASDRIDRHRKSAAACGTIACFLPLVSSVGASRRPDRPSPQSDFVQ
jgi:hypothetical protein